MVLVGHDHEVAVAQRLGVGVLRAEAGGICFGGGGWEGGVDDEGVGSVASESCDNTHIWSFRQIYTHTYIMLHMYAYI